MKKKEFKKPTIKTVKMEGSNIICASGANTLSVGLFSGYSWSPTTGGPTQW